MDYNNNNSANRGSRSRFFSPQKSTNDRIPKQPKLTQRKLNFTSLGNATTIQGNAYSSTDNVNVLTKQKLTSNDICNNMENVTQMNNDSFVNDMNNSFNLEKKRKRNITDEMVSPKLEKRQKFSTFTMEEDFGRPSRTFDEFRNGAADIVPSQEESLLKNCRSRMFFQERKVAKEKIDERFPFMDPEKRRDGNGRRPDDPNYDPSTLYISNSDLGNLTQMSRQYWEIKKDRMDTILFFKKGKFYEMYEDDADIAHKEFDLKISPRINMRMAGVPEASKESWIRRFLQRGYKVAVVEQVETRNAANQRKKADIVKRQLTEIISPGTIVDSEMLDNDESKYLLILKENILDKSYGVIFADLSRAEVNIGFFEDDAHRTLFDTLIHQIHPVEILFEKGNISQRSETILKNMNPPPTIERIASQHFNAEDTRQTIDIEGIFEEEGATETGRDAWPEVLREYSDNDTLMAAFGVFIRHLKTYMKLEETIRLRNFKKYEPEKDNQNMMLYGETLINLEILKNKVEGSSRGTLLEHISHCVTPFGKRLFRKWILHPLRNVNAIEERLNAIDDLEELQWDSEDANKLKGITDIERNLRTIHAFSICEHSVVTFDESVDKKRSIMFFETLSGMERLLEIARVLESRRQKVMLTSNSIASASKLSSFDEENIPIVDATSFPNVEPLLKKFRHSFNMAIYEEKQILFPVENGGYKKFDEICEKIRDLYRESDALLLEYQKYFKSKDVKFNSPRSGTFSLLVEVPRSVESKIGNVPTTFKYDRDTKVVKRYKDTKLDIIVEKIITAEEEKDKIVTQFLRDTFSEFSKYFRIWNRCVSIMATLDCIHSLWKTSKFPSHTRPQFLNSLAPEFRAEGLFHPCVHLESGKEYIPNDIRIGGDRQRTAILTGPNMGGKSSLLRCVCVAAIMAQIGCYVPASLLQLTPIDSIFTRIGANDRICAGESTFMVELLETSNILKHSTKHSLVILDELGRGTSTTDGYSIAYAVAKHLAEEVQCLTLFSTHYHSLTDEVKNNPLYALYCMDSIVKEVNGVPHVDFLYKLREGVCSDSYGLNVARIARIPDEVLLNAQSITHELKMESLQEKILSLYETIIQNQNDVSKLKELKDKAIQILY